MNAISRDKILDRIRKLLSLAGANPNEHERDAAMAKAQQMLIDHNLQMSEVGNLDGEDLRVAEWNQTTRNGQWARRIAQSVGRLYFCGYIYRPMGKKVVHSFVGTETNGKIASEISGYVIEAVYHEGARAMRAAGAANSFWTSFVNAASLRVRLRVDKLVLAAGRDQEHQSSSRALVVVDMYKQAEADAARYMASMNNLKTTVARPMQNKNLEGWQAGTSFGDNVSLTQSLGSASGKQRRIK